MEKLLAKREKLDSELQAEWIKYREVIANGKTFDEAKVIYLHIKELQKEILQVTNQIHKKLKIGE